MSTVQDKGLVTWDYPRFAVCVRTWSAVRGLDPWPHNLYDLKLWRSVLEAMDDGTIDVEGSVDWLLQQSWEDERNVFDEWMRGCVYNP